MTTHQANRFSSLIGEIYDSAIAPALRSGVLEQVAHFVGGFAAMIVSRDSARLSIEIHQHFGIDARFRQLYRDRYVELDLLLELLDRKKPQVIVNFAAQGEGAVSWKHSWRFFETNSMALARLAEELMKRDWLERFIQIGTSEMYGSV